ncbi:GRP family sugar transporter [Lentilactobacillus otakiensis]|uniref:GRP family sugar transporter n=1 Tax=Lentilactobacillus otakiensis TaxID=481720 RepID=UPI003D185DA3
MNALLMIMPAIGWGLLPPVVARIGGKPANQIFGTAVGALLSALALFVFYHPHISIASFLIAALAGAFWVIGQIGQFIGLKNIGVSATMPVSTGMQLIGTSLVGVVIFGEWSAVSEKVLGALGILVLIIGIWLTSIRDQRSGKKGHDKNQVNTMIMLLFTTLGYIVYMAIPRGLSSSGLAIFLPECVGMVIAVLMYVIVTRQTAIFKESASWLCIAGGLVYAFGAITYILSVNANGVNSAFVASQLAVVISTLLGMIWMHETKSRREMMYMIFGLVLIVSGAVITTVF